MKWKYQRIINADFVNQVATDIRQHFFKRLYPNDQTWIPWNYPQSIISFWSEKRNWEGWVGGGERDGGGERKRERESSKHRKKKRRNGDRREKRTLNFLLICRTGLAAMPIWIWNKILKLIARTLPMGKCEIFWLLEKKHDRMRIWTLDTPVPSGPS